MNRICLAVLAFLFFVVGESSSQTVLTLDQCKTIALEHNTKMKNSALEVEASQQVRKSALTKYFPNVSAAGAALRAQDNLVGLSLAPEVSFGMLERMDFGAINIVQPVFTGGRILAGNKLAAIGQEVSEDQQSLAKNEVALKTEQQYWQIVSLQEKMKTIQRYDEMLDSLSKQVDDAYQSGIVMVNDLLKVKVKRSEVRLNKSKLENGRQLAIMAFCQYIGIPFDSTMKLNDTLVVEGSPQSLYVDHSAALSRRTEYRLLQKSVEAEEWQTRLKTGEYLPQVAVGASALYYKLDQMDGKYDRMAFVTVQVPISNWWEASHTMQERSAREEIARNNFNENSDLLLLQMKKAWQDLSDSYKQVSLSEESKAQADENLKVNNDSYRNGLTNVSDLLEAQAMLLQANNDLIDAKANYKIQQTTYLQVTGR
jgi:outer membrane protein TolC